jgi:hypothetical protein
MNSSSKSCYTVATDICSNVQSEGIFYSISVMFVMLSPWSHGLQLRTANKMAPNQRLEMGLTKIHNKI